ncbi:MAG: MopE-related protein [Myxococcota bacterium]|nr:MopE-related protein [Myxococcota bacterium]
MGQPSWIGVCGVLCLMGTGCGSEQTLQVRDILEPDPVSADHPVRATWVAFEVEGSSIDPTEEPPPPPIINGSVADDTYEAVGALIARYGGGYYIYCSATLIDESWVLTAAHCTEAADDYETMGYSNEFLITSDATVVGAWEEQIALSFWDRHEDYDSDTLENDIGIAELETALTSIDPIAVNTDGVDTSLVGQEMRYVGFGATSDNGSGAGTRLTAAIPVNDVTDYHVETFDPDDGENLCQGDSGGAAMDESGSDLLLLGVNSYTYYVDGAGPNYCEGGGAGSARVDQAIEFIGNYAPISSGSASGVDELSAGDLVLTEIMVDPADCGDFKAEYFEIYNSTASPVNLQGLELDIASGSSETVDETAVIGPGDYAVVARRPSATQCHGLDADALTDIKLANGGDVLSIGYGSTTFDEVDYGGWTVPSGASLALDPDSVDASDNDDEDSWCAATSTISGATDLGTPGVANDSCGCDDPDTWYADADADGYGDPDDSQEACSQPSGYVTDSSDCDDADEGVNPDEVETCETEYDDNCDGVTNERNALSCSMFYKDVDGDDYGDGDIEARCFCEEKFKYSSSEGTDCDDSDSSSYPGGTEICDDADNDCDGVVDEDLDQVWYADADSDGYGDGDSTTNDCSQPTGYVAEMNDCDDTDGAVSPGATETCATEYDDDCDLISNERDADECVDFFKDVDEDGYGNSDLATRCFCEEKFKYTTTEGEDCDDSDDSVSPALPELCTTDYDDDCDGVINERNSSDCTVFYKDVDGDGFGTTDVEPRCYCEETFKFTAADAGDCDDAESSVNPTAEEVCDDGIDQDCDGEDNCESGTSVGLDVAATWIGGASDSDYAGYGVCIAGDMDGDGAGEVVVTAYAANANGPNAGAAYVVAGPVTADLDLSDATARIDGESSSDRLGYGPIAAAGNGDVDGDGFSDLVLGSAWHDQAASNAGSVYLLLGPVSGVVDASEADAEILGEASADYAGGAVALGDLDDDGYTDVLVGADRNDYAGKNAGAVYVVLGPVSGDLDLADADARITGEAKYDYAGVALDAQGDVDGDGSVDLVVGAFGQDGGGAKSGAAYLVHGPVGGNLALGDADAVFVGEGANDYAGVAVNIAGDINGDGHDDVLVGADNANSAFGAVYVLYGPVSGEVDLSGADAIMDGTASGDQAGASLASGDADEDGYDEVVLGAPEYASTGGVFLWYGPVTGAVDLGDADLTLEGAAEGDEAGSSLDVRDLDGDGQDDLLIGAPAESSNGEAAGAAYLLYGSAL